MGVTLAPRSMTSPVRLLPLAVLVLVASLAPAGARGQEPAAPAWFGAVLTGVELERAATVAAADGAAAAVRLDQVVAGGPASRSGFEAGDLLLAVDGAPLGADGDAARARLVDLLAERAPGDRLAVGFLRRVAAWTRDGAPLAGGVDPASLEAGLAPGERTDLSLSVVWERRDLVVTLGKRPEASGRPLPPTDALYAHYPRTSTPLLAEVTAALAAAGATADQADLRARLARLAERGDGSANRLVPLVHREPWRLPTLAEAMGADLLAAARLEGPALLDGLGAHLARAADLPSPAEAPAVRGDLATPPAKGAGLAAHLAWMEALLAAAGERVEAALADLDPGARDHVRAHWRDLADRFDDHIYLYLDPDEGRYARNRATIAAGEAVDPAPLLEVPALFTPLLDPDYHEVLAQELYAAGHDVWANTTLDHPTPLGRIVIGGKGDGVHRRGSQGLAAAPGDQVALLLDLGGSDQYADGIGSTVDQAGRPGIPVAVVLDLEGDDIYEATHDGAIGCGVLGVGLVLDAAGDDSYVGRRWSQGAGLAGLGLVLDGRGDDRYRMATQGQGIGAWGLGALVDGYGSDRYEALQYGQAVGLAGGAGLLLDGWGDDEYYAKGRQPTGYGTAGVFEGWSQGCGVGFRGDASGGLGLLVDGAGRDRFEAGNFAQGGGYYFGFGGLWAYGLRDDLYIGSRYDQGFAAHQAVGWFLEMGGDDVYETRNAVAHGLAWDESVTWFEDRAGEDRYRGGGFSLGAAAHNAIAVFREGGGADTYLRGEPARAESNQYHGGTSLAWFVDEGGEQDTWPEESAPPAELTRPTHGFVRLR